ncbi:MAG: FGGY family carbohydrate kinase [Paracoccaceae bacterium]
MRVVAVDQGTSSTRAFVLNKDGTGAIVCTRSHQQTCPHPGWVEHNPLELLSNIKSCLNAAGSVDAIGIANQGESCLAWDARTGAPISPVIVWQDRRTENVITNLKQQGLDVVVRQKSGLPLDPYFSASKLGWIMAHIPQAQALATSGHLRLGTTDAFFLDRLTGHFATDLTTASRTSLLNLTTQNWDAELCNIFCVPIEALPEIRSSNANFGNIELAGSQIPVAASIVDQQASLYGHGCRNPGDTKITFGTGAFVLSLADGKPVSGPELFPTVAWQTDNTAPQFALEGGVYCAGSAINWARSLGLFTELSKINTFDTSTAISRNIAFVPALTGLASPHWDGSAAGMWIGMTLDTSPSDLIQAILEGIALRAVEVVSAMNKTITIGPSISIDGGLSNNPYFCQFLADMLEKEIVVSQNTELTALGTAQMAAGKRPNSASRPETSKRYISNGSSQNAKDRFADAISRARHWNPVPDDG